MWILSGRAKSPPLYRKRAIFSPLMGVLEVFTFPQFDKWCKEMAQAGMEPVVAFDSKHISMMGELFAKPIDGTDPLYSDLAHAMRNKDRENALNILRIIRRKTHPIPMRPGS